ncbi:hypothetical protein JQS43_02160 [Natronosporangium hydrolyticum]|uniref:Uncharacterized protein n=1 Tax=Natronosporangium hydrolyticum TaxID=2811111 RepID=A0A895YGJ7_9ACTN|nr:hypothetical protein [Natronosporangium hydrolyticum]QSB15195.1 hypothetical protein JQS43_02160 [Natronosporangium hydrolyticum]
MSTLADDSIVLAHRRWLMAPRVTKVLLGLAGLAAAGVVLAGAVPAQPTLAFTAGWTLATVLLIIGGGWLAFDGATELLRCRRLRRLPRPSIRLDATGLHYRDGDESGAVSVSVPWSEVRGCAVRPGFGGNRFLCFDVPGRYPEPAVAEIGDVIVDPDAVRARAYGWSMTVCPEPLSAAERNMLITAYVFGTPFAVDLSTCRGVDTARIGRAVFGWTGGRCRPPAW